ncbi:ABC transporter permease [Streptacidiphilus anmyonensis]|uniref:ABC transporter permease n=1 Tax=Streptacidiphilus anmyonensis TaxID=405782 RepID=UPI0005AB1D5B|nr:ABC transporter permease [Streptacidiphilus anmyonensis]
MSETLAAVRAEFTKVRCVRTTYLALLLFVPLSLLVAALDGASARSAIDSHNPLLRAGFTPQQAGLDGILYGQLALIVFGVLVVSSEYGSGMVRVSLLAVPRRGRLFAVKSLVAAAVTAAVAIPVTVLGYLATQAALGPHGASIGDAGVPLALGGAVGYLTLMSLFALGVAATARSAVLPLAVLLPMVLAGSHILTVIGATRQLAQYFPDQAGLQMLTVGSHRAVTGFAVLLAWTAAALACGFLRQWRWDG